jgi:hypothetical protein
MHQSILVTVSNITFQVYPEVDKCDWIRTF